MDDQIFNLSKESPVFDLSKDADASILEDLILGCGWKCKGFTDVDVDLSAILYDKDGTHVETVYYGNKELWLLNNSIFHCGDDLTGSDAQTYVDNEQIKVKLANMPSNVASIFVTANVYNGNLKDLESCYVCIRDVNQNKILNSDMSNLKEKGVVLAAIVKEGANWSIARIDTPVDAFSGSTTMKFIDASTFNVGSSVASSARRIASGQLAGLSNRQSEERPGFFSRLFGRR